MSNDIIFQDDDSLKQTLEKVVYLWAGTTELEKNLKLHGVTNYTKVNKGAFVTYVLRSKEIGKLIVKL